MSAQMWVGCCPILDVKFHFIFIYLFIFFYRHHVVVRGLVVSMLAQ